jgi:hypothetical protein
MDGEVDGGRLKQSVVDEAVMHSLLKASAVFRVKALLPLRDLQWD